MLLFLGKLFVGPHSCASGTRSIRRQQAHASFPLASCSAKVNKGNSFATSACRRGAWNANRQAPKAVGRHDGSRALYWDAAALGEALLVPPPAAVALAASLEAAENLPRGLTIDEVQTRCGVLQRELELDPRQVARMVALEPAFLACPTAALRARAQQLAFLLNSRRTAPAAPSHSNDTSQGTAPTTTSRANSSSTTQGGPERPTRTAAAAAAAAAPVAAAPSSSAPSSPSSAAARPIDTGGRCQGGSEHAGGGSPNDAGLPVTQQSALVLIARQPALLQMPPDLLITRCMELADLLDVTPHDSCMCLTRMRPEELARMLQAPPSVVQESWLGLVTALAAIEQPGLYAAHIPGAPAPRDDGRELSGPPSNGDGAGGGADRRPPVGGAQGARGPSPPQQQQLTPRSRSRWRAPSVFPPGVEDAARRAVLLCPPLLMLPAGWVRASALHLAAVLGLSPAGLRRLLSRSPRLLLLPKRHREDALRSLAEQLVLRRPEDAARMVAQQPNLLKWTPLALGAKLEEMAAALGLSHGGVTRLVRNQPALLAMSSQSLAAKLLWLQRVLRLPDADAARRLALRQPGVLSMSSATLERKVRLLAHGLGLTNAFVSSAAAAAAPTSAAAPVTADAAPAPLAAGAAGSPAKAVAAAAAATARTQAERGAVLRTVLRLVVEEPTLLTMSVDAIPRRLEQLAEALGAATMHEVRAAVLSCPRLLLVQRGSLQYRLRELAFGLDAPARAVKQLVLARPGAFFMPLPQLRAAVEARVEAAAAQAGVRSGGRRLVAAALEELARDPVGEDLGDASQGGWCERVT